MHWGVHGGRVLSWDSVRMAEKICFVLIMLMSNPRLRWIIFSILLVLISVRKT